MESEFPSQNRDRSFWILFSAGWLVYAGLMALTSVLEGQPLLTHAATAFPPALFSIFIAANRRAFPEARMAHLEDRRNPLRHRPGLCHPVSPSEPSV